MQFSNLIAITLLALAGFAAHAGEAAGAAGDAPASGAAQAAADDAHGKQAGLRITGMVCQACVKAITKALHDVKGVKRCTVTLEPPRATVTYEPAETNVAALVAAVNNLGYKAQAE